MQGLKDQRPEGCGNDNTLFEQRHTVHLCEVIPMLEIFPQLKSEQLLVRGKPLRYLVCQEPHGLVLLDLIPDLLLGDGCGDVGGDLGRDDHVNVLTVPVMPRDHLPVIT